MRSQLLVFLIEDRKYALRASSVQRVVRAVEVVPLPAAPEIVSGIIDVGGRIIPVVNMRKRFRLPEREIDPKDHMIIARTSRREVVLIVDGTEGVIELPDDAIVPADRVLPEMDYVDGVVSLEDGLILIHDLDHFLSLDEEQKLDGAINPTSVAPGAIRRERES